MAGGNRERKHGKRRHTQHVERAAGQLVTLRQELLDVDWTDRQDELAECLGDMVSVGAEMVGRSTRMDRDGASRRAACERIVTQMMLSRTAGVEQPSY